MNAADHLQLAVQLLGPASLGDPIDWTTLTPQVIATAQAHALCALAIELGVPAPALSVSSNVTPIKRPPAQTDNGADDDQDQEATG